MRLDVLGTLLSIMQKDKIENVQFPKKNVVK